MECTINSRKLRKEITFSRPGSYYIFVDLNGKSGSLGLQICDGGACTGSTLGCKDSYDVFEKTCKRWWKDYLRVNKDYIETCRVMGVDPR